MQPVQEERRLAHSDPDNTGHRAARGPPSTTSSYPGHSERGKVLTHAAVMDHEESGTEHPEVTCLETQGHLTWVFWFNGNSHNRRGFEAEGYKRWAGRQAAQRGRLQHGVLQASYPCGEKRRTVSLRWQLPQCCKESRGSHTVFLAALENPG